MKALNSVSLELGKDGSLPQLSTMKSVSQVEDIRKHKGLLNRGKSNEKIIVNNDEMRLKMLEKIHDYMQEIIPSGTPSNPEEVSYGPIDSFNMNYLRSKGQNHTKDTSNRSSVLSLPKIKHSSSHSTLLPREREKIKDKPIILTERRRTYDEKLRQ